MQSVFSTKDDAPDDGGLGQLIVDDGKIVWGKASKSSSDNECTASWITEITSLSSAEEEDDDHDQNKTANESILDGPQPAVVAPLAAINCTSSAVEQKDTMSCGDGLSLTRKSLRKKTTSEKALKLKLARGASRRPSGAGVKMACPRGRGGRIMRTMGFKGHKKDDDDVHQGSLWLQDTSLKLEDVDGDDGHPGSFVGSTQRPSSDSGVSNVDSLESVAEVKVEQHINSNANMAASFSLHPSKDATSILIKEIFYKQPCLSVSKSCQTNSGGAGAKFDHQASPADQPAPKINGTQMQARPLKLKVAPARKKRKVAPANGSVAARKLVPKPKAVRDYSRKEVKDLIEGSIKVAKIVALGSPKAVAAPTWRVPLALPPAVTTTTMTPIASRTTTPTTSSSSSVSVPKIAPPVLFVKNAANKHRQLSAALAATMKGDDPTTTRTTVVLASPTGRGSKLKCTLEQALNFGKPVGTSHVPVPAKLRTILPRPPPPPPPPPVSSGSAVAAGAAPKSPPPVLLIKTVRNLPPVTSNSKSIIQLMSASKTAPKITTTTTTTSMSANKPRINRPSFKPFLAMPRTAASITNKVQASAASDVVQVPPVLCFVNPPPAAIVLSTTCVPPAPTLAPPTQSNDVQTSPSAGLRELLSMQRATKYKAIQKISAIVSRKKKPVSARKRKRSPDENNDDDDADTIKTTGNVTSPKPAAAASRSSDQLPPLPPLIPCSMSRTEELQRKNLQDKLLCSTTSSSAASSLAASSSAAAAVTTSSTSVSNLQCRVNIPHLDRYPLASKLQLAPPRIPRPRVLYHAEKKEEAESDEEGAASSSAQPPPAVEKKPQGRPRIHRAPEARKPARFSRNGRRIGRPPIRSFGLTEGLSELPPSDSVDVSPPSIVSQELKRLRLLSPMLSGLNLPGFGGSKAAGHNALPCVDQPQRSSTRQTECAFRYREIALRKHDNFTQIVLTSSTRVRNGLNCQVLRELKMALDAARTDKNCHVVLFNGTGSVFCSGIDLISLVKDGESTSIAKEMSEALRDFCKAVMSFPKTLVAAVNGAAVGLGVTMLPLFDMVYASDKATFYTPYVKLGQIPEGGATFSLPFAMGFARANGLLLGGRQITATEACEWGLVTQVLWPSAFMEGVIPQVQAMAKQSLQTMGCSKALIRYHSVRELEVTLDIECRILAEQWASPECIQSIREFLDKEEVV